jgi:hypothetical protein
MSYRVVFRIGSSMGGPETDIESGDPLQLDLSSSKTFLKSSSRSQYLQDGGPSRCK